MPSCGAETHLFFSHETSDASDTSASRTRGPCRPASPRDSIRTLATRPATSSKSAWTTRWQVGREHCLSQNATKRHDLAGRTWQVPVCRPPPGIPAVSGALGASQRLSRVRSDVRRRSRGGTDSRAAVGWEDPVGFPMVPRARASGVQSRRQSWVAASAANGKGQIRAGCLFQLARLAASLTRTRAHQQRAGQQGRVV